MELDKGYRASLFFLGDRILVGRPTGYGTMNGVKNLVRLTKEIETEICPPGARYVRIIDFAGFDGITLAARKHFSDEMKKRPNTRAMIFCNVSPFFRLAAHLANRLHRLPFEVKIARDYPEAARLSKSLLDADEGADGEPSRELKAGSFSIRFEILRRDTVHSVSSGFLDGSHDGRVRELRKSVIATLDPEQPCYYIAGVQGVTGGTLQGRRRHMASLADDLTTRPFKLVVFYGANWYIRAAVHLARPYIDAKVRIVKDLESARAIIEKEREGAGAADKDPPGSFTSRSVEELLEYLGGLDWEGEHFETELDMGKDHPFRPVFEAIALIRTELDYLARDRREAEEELLRTKDDVISEMTRHSSYVREVTHHLRNPLQKLKGYMELLEREDLTERQRELLEKIKAGERELEEGIFKLT